MIGKISPHGTNLESRVRYLDGRSGREAGAVQANWRSAR